MSETKFTKGPWRVGTIDPRIVYDGTVTGWTIASTIVRHDRQIAGEAEANARLIAAAPELYEAISEFLPGKIDSGNQSVPDDVVIPLDVTMGELRRLEAAIAKARGEA